MSRTRILNMSVRDISAGKTIVDLEGAIDIQNSHGLRTLLFEKLAVTSRLMVNMSGIRYVDSSGIATLIEVLKKAVLYKGAINGFEKELKFHPDDLSAKTKLGTCYVESSSLLGNQPMKGISLLREVVQKDSNK